MDYGHKWTDDGLKKLEKRITAEYTQAAQEVQEKLDKYIERFNEKDERKREQVKNGEITQAEYTRWRYGQVMMQSRWEEMRDTLAEDLTMTGEKVDSMTQEFCYDAYAMNHNYGTFEVEKGSQLDTSYTLYDRSTVERLVRDDPQMLPPPGKKVSDAIRRGEAKLWNQKQIQSVMAQALLQGEPIPKIAKRLAEAVGDKDKNASIRNARTMVTGAENAGRADSYERAQNMGIPVRKQWLATLDSRTRHEHRQLDGEIVDNDKPFIIDGQKIRFPGDPEAAGYLVYNCRCTLVAAIKGFESDMSDINLRHNKHLNGMSYEEWKNAKQKPDQEDKQPVKEKPKVENTNDVNKVTAQRLKEAYENHRKKGNTNAVPLSELEKEGLAGNLFTADYGKMSVESARTFDRTLGKLMSEYDTPLTKVRVMTKEEFLYNGNAFGYVHHDYTIDSATMVINPSKCKDITTLSDRIKTLSEDGYCAKIKPDRAEEYVVTHEFAHSIINMSEPLKNKTNWVNADYDVVRNARKEIEPIYNEYMKDVGSLTKNAKDLELKALTATDFDDMEKYGNLASSAYDALDAVKISDYSLSDIDEFVAESFANEKLGETSNSYASRVVGVIDKYFGR